MIQMVVDDAASCEMQQSTVRLAERAEQERAHAEELRQAYLRQKAAEEAAMGEEMQQLQRELEEKRRREEQEKVCALCFALVVLCAL